MNVYFQRILNQLSLSGRNFRCMAKTEHITLTNELHITSKVLYSVLCYKKGRISDLLEILCKSSDLRVNDRANPLVRVWRSVLLGLLGLS